MKVKATKRRPTEVEYDIILTLTKSELENLMACIRNTNNRFLYYQPSVVDLHNLLHEQTGIAYNLAHPAPPGPLVKKYDDYGTWYGNKYC